jgi:chaperonin cofactor prefoldin
MSEQRQSTDFILRNKFQPHEWVMMREVGAGSGYLDYMFINLWSSRGFAIHGMEKKSNRGDWLKEIKNPKKQETHFQYCDYFWLVTDKDNVAKIEEIPISWGWYHITPNGTVRTMKTAPKLKPIPITKSFMASMFRRAADMSKYVHVDSLEEEIERRTKVMVNNITSKRSQEQINMDKLKENIELFEKASGLSLELWRDWWQRKYSPKTIGYAIGLIVKYGIPEQLESLEHHVERLRKIANEIEGGINELRKKYKYVDIVEKTES